MPPKNREPIIEWLEGDVYIWKFKFAKSGWLSPHNTAMSLYEKQDILGALNKMPIASPESFSAEWSKVAADEHKVGLFCKK